VSQPTNFADEVALWAARVPFVKAVILFGSRAPNKDGNVRSADVHSDWDFQIITSRPRKFLGGEWLRELTNSPLQVYAVRTPRLGSMPKIHAIFAGAEADFVILPAFTLQCAKIAVGLGLHHRFDRLYRGLQDLSIVIRPGYRFLKGGSTWEPFYRRVLSEVRDPRLDDADVVNLANGFLCDYLWIQRKLDRGELIAARRMLHRELMETNLRLLHELKLRRGELSFPEGRRVELVTTPKELTMISVNEHLDVDGLRDAAAQTAETLRNLVEFLIGDMWRWPDKYE
jgi:hypothetical protein